MSILKQLARQVKVKEYKQQELLDGSDTFPVVVFEGAVVGVDSQGATRLTYRDNVHFSAFGFDMNVLKDTFGEEGTVHKGLWIEQYKRSTPREWISPEGEVVMITHDYRITDGSFSEPVAPVGAPSSQSRTPVEAEVFSDITRKNDLQPQI